MGEIADAILDDMWAEDEMWYEESYYLPPVSRKLTAKEKYDFAMKQVRENLKHFTSIIDEEEK